MRKIFGLKIILLPILFTAICNMEACAPSSTNVAGTWNLRVETEKGKQSVVLVLNQQGERLTGSLRSLEGGPDLDNVALDGSIRGRTINFSMSPKGQEKASNIKYSGTVNDDSMKGDVNFGERGPGNWTAERTHEPVQASSTDGSRVNITGVWKFVVDTLGGVGKPTFTFTQEGEKLTGSYIGPLGEKTVAGTIQNGKTVFHIDVNVNGEDLTVTYSGTVVDEKNMKGSVKFGDNHEGGEGTWTGKRQ